MARTIPGHEPSGDSRGAGAKVSASYLANPMARNNALDCLRIWGRVAFVGEGNLTTINLSPQMPHKQFTVVGSRVFGLWELKEPGAFYVQSRWTEVR